MSLYDPFERLKVDPPPKKPRRVKEPNPPKQPKPKPVKELKKLGRPLPPEKNLPGMGYILFERNRRRVEETALNSTQHE